MYFLISHVVYQKDMPIFGPIHVVEQFLSSKQEQSIKIFSPLERSGDFVYSDTQNTISFRRNFNSLVIKYLYDLYFVTTRLCKKFPTNLDTVIVADPLNAVGVNIVRLFRKFNYIYYTVDFTENRFNSQVLSTIYKVLDRWAMHMCDQNWCVSSRITAMRSKTYQDNQIHFVPNTNIINGTMPKRANPSTNKLIYVGRMVPSMSIFTLLRAMRKLSDEDVQVSLTLVGDGKLEKQILRFIKDHKLKNQVKYLGPLPNQDVQRLIAEHDIGIALYTNDKNWNRYGDSMKIREYQLYGLPVITTEIPSNSDEILEDESGIVISSKEITIDRIISSIKSIKKRYKYFSKNAYQNAKNHDKSKLLTQLLKL